MIIINADDFGYSGEVNAAIAEAFRGGFISSATIMANAPAFAEACQLAKQMNLLQRVGIHLNLSEGAPLTEPIKACPAFFRPERGLCFQRETRLALSVKEMRAVRAEIAAQIARCRDAGLPLTHADSHKHSHTELPLFLCYASVLKRAGIRHVRLTDNVRPASGARRFYKRFFNTVLAALGLRGADYFTDLANLPRLGSEVARSDRVIEIMVHAAHSREGVLIDAGTKIPLAEVARLLPAESRVGSYGSS